MSRQSGTPREPRAINPLWMISLFLTFSEVAVGAAATQTQGWLQAVLVLFAVIFPTGIATTFFAVLLMRPYVLYAPKDYSTSTSVGEFVNTLNTSRNRSLESMEASIRSAMEEVLPRLLDARSEGRSDEVIVAEVVENARADFLSHFVEISFEGIDLSLESAHIPVDETTSVQTFLDEAWAYTRGFVPPYTYGNTWALVDRRTGRSYAAMGTLWAGRHGSETDTRRLYAVGIRAGDLLDARLLFPVPSRSPERRRRAQA